MEPYEEHDQHQNNEHRPSDVPTTANHWLVVALIILLAVAGYAVNYGARQRSLAEQMKQQAAANTASMDQLQAQVSTLTAKQNELTSAQPPAASPAPASTAPAAADEDSIAPAPAPVAASPAVVATPKPAPAKRAATKRRAAPVDKRYAQLKSQLDAQEKELKYTQDAVAKNRADLEGSISSTRDELNGSIAKTHDELVALEKRGERSYFEFDLSKSKEFQRFGPLTISLRKADTKHKNYDLAMIVDDNELNKKKVNLYEPIWIHTESGGQPVQIVVNRIEKNLVHGYVSAPKYKQSELAALSSSMAPPPDSGHSQPVSQPQQ